VVADSLGKDLRSLRMSSLIIGGMGNHRGAILGAILVPVAFEEATRYIPPVPGNPNLIPALQWVVIGLLILTFLWFRPEGILPERRRKILAGAEGPGGVDEAVGSPGLAGTPTLGAKIGPAGGPAQTWAPQDSGDGASGVILECVGLSRSFDGLRAVDDVSMKFERGRLTGIIGPNGAGKSTALAMLAGTLPATEGRILLRGEDVTALPAYRRARQGLVRTFQLASEFKHLTVIENLLAAIPGQRGESFRGAVLGSRYWGAQETTGIERARATLERFGLLPLADRYAGELSGGQRRLVEIMRALMAEPEVLLLDEPMAGVHPRLAHQIGMLLVSLCAEGTTVIMVEHELSIMDEFCDPVFVLAEGQVLAQGTMAALRAKEEVVEAYLVG
ncbi:MAG: ATP-binding cassette domain-containing protein, partial [Solirubrobacteraceae bacterium]